MKSTTVKPQSIYLNAEDVAQVEKIAKALGVTPHALRAYAVKRLIADWARGWRPKQTKKTVKTLEP